ncbi:ribonuclease R [Roseburia sp. OF03-24]|jgi:ribonuclease R|uniref:ribonuclease R n=1 Tax=Roseburia sp. OF03-24 TaxID=2292367 RepID=UPI000E50CF75|nr:ribonuclease R [Roseburia sp. OF03-24]RGX91973.1 ribonuclease R [Roseburia sp. OF03-24]
MEKTILEERKKTIYQFICDEFYVPMKAKEMAVVLSVPKSQRSELQEVLDALVMDGRIEVTSKGKYIKSEGKYLTGTFTAHARGFGFVSIEGEEEDIFIPESQVHGAFHMDTVQVAITSENTGRRREGTITKIISRGTTRIVCTYEKSKTFGFAVPDNPKFGSDIFIPQERSKGAVSGHKVVVEITDYGKEGRKPEGKVVEIIGHINDPGTDIMSIVKAYDLPVEFSEKIMHQVENVSNEVSTADMAGRMDFREWQTVTIDGEDAKDLDDAITLTKEGDNYKLGVHIADVSNYVQEHSALDVEALSRGTSVYLVDRVIPMLPHKLSNGICSLNAGENRLTLSCVMTIDPKGNVIDHTIAESVIKVDRRMSYTSVKKILEDHDENEIREYENLVPMFELMRELAAILRKKRMKRGSIDFDFPETKIVLDEKGKPIEIKPYERNVATKIIEDFMLIANETVAQDYFWQELPFVYRTHDNPDTEKIKKLSTFINNFGYSIHIGQDEVHPKELQKLLQKIDGTPEEALISRLTLRSMKQAKYTTMSTGHFGLATPYYCHFTSPIRRYPDLQIHRIIKDNLRGRMNAKKIEHYDKILPEVAKHSSEMERRADEAERETDKLKKVEYMSERIGEVFEGVISGVTEWGFYVELPNTVEGLVHVTTLVDDYFHYNESTYELVGEVTNIRYKLGQRVHVMVTGTDRILRTIDFRVVRQDEREAGKE